MHDMSSVFYPKNSLVHGTKRQRSFAVHSASHIRSKLPSKLQSMVQSTVQSIVQSPGFTTTRQYMASDCVTYNVSYKARVHALDIDRRLRFEK